MAISKTKATFPQDILTVWNTVTDLCNYSWRSDLARIEAINAHQFIEYTKDGYATRFTVTCTDPCDRWEFDLDNSNMTGHWTGVFTEENGQTVIDFTEEVFPKKQILKPFVKLFLKKQQAQYVSDLRKVLKA